MYFWVVSVSYHSSDISLYSIDSAISTGSAPSKKSIEIRYYEWVIYLFFFSTTFILVWHEPKMARDSAEQRRER